MCRSSVRPHLSLGESPGDDHVYIVTFHILHLVFQVVVRNAPLFPDRTGWGPFLRQLWPLTFSGVEWPPDQWIEDTGGVKALSESFSHGSSREWMVRL